MPPNRIEEIKRAKDGLDVLPDLHRYAREGVEAIPDDDFERLKWYGLFHRKATPGYFMLRMRIPNGALTSEQLAAVGEIANRCGRGAADLTTRQNLQLRWIAIGDAPWALQRLAAAGLNTQQSGMDNVRNVVGCPLAGLDADELIDTRPLAARLQQAIVGHKRYSNLPRKFNLAIGGCREDCVRARTHDLAFAPAVRAEDGEDGAAGFNVLAGGAMGGREPELARPLDVFAAPREVVPVAEAVLSAFRDHGPRERRNGARLKMLLREWGAERFRAEVEARAGFPLRRAGEPATARSGGDHLGVSPQRQPGLRVVGCHVPVGRAAGDDLIAFARLAAEYGASELRLTVEQNVLIPHVPEERVGALLAEPLLAKFSPRPSPWLRSLVTCTGNDYCHFSLIDTKGEALRLADALERRWELDDADAPLRIRVSGCPHACGQHRAGEIGLLGDRVRGEDGPVDAADVFAGGRTGEDARLGEPVARGVTMAGLPEAVAAQVRALRGDAALRERGPSRDAPAGVV